MLITAGEEELLYTALVTVKPVAVTEAVNPRPSGGDGGRTVIADAFSSVTESAVPRQRAPGDEPAGSLHVRVGRPRPGTAVVAVRGELDALSAPRLTNLLVARLRSTLRTLVIDLSEVDFLAAAGLSVLVHADLLARQLGVTLEVVTGGNRWAERALSVTKLDTRLRFSTR